MYYHYSSSNTFTSSKWSALSSDSMSASIQTAPEFSKTSERKGGQCSSVICNRSVLVIWALLDNHIHLNLATNMQYILARSVAYMAIPCCRTESLAFKDCLSQWSYVRVICSRDITVCCFSSTRWLTSSVYYWNWPWAQRNSTQRATVSSQHRRIT